MAWIIYEIKSSNDKPRRAWINPRKKNTSYIQNKWIANSFAHKTIFNDTLNFKFEPIHKAKINITLTKSLNIKNVALKNQRSKSLLYWREVGNVEFHIRPSLLYKSYGIQVKNTILFKLADRMRCMRTNGASKNRDSWSFFWWWLCLSFFRTL